jgi:DNA uptake protein ComE-like DNA-binding protein
MTISGANGNVMAATITTTAAPAAKMGYTPVSGSDAAAVNQALQTKLSTSSSSSSGGGGGLKSIPSVYALVNSSVTVPTGSGQTAKNVTLTSPLNDAGQLATILPLLLDQTTTSQAPDLTPRINVNVASQTVLSTLPGFSPADIQSIISNRPTPSPSASIDPIYQTPAWLLTQGNISASTMQSVERFITARSFVYRFQSIGYFNDGSGPSSRLEAVVDTNFGRPRIVYLRDITELGKGGFDLTGSGGMGGNTNNSTNPNQ